MRQEKTSAKINEMSDIRETRNLDKTLDEIWKKTKREEKIKYGTREYDETKKEMRWNENYSKNTRKDVQRLEEKKSTANKQHNYEKGWEWDKKSQYKKRPDETRKYKSKYKRRQKETTRTRDKMRWNETRWEKWAQKTWEGADDLSFKQYDGGSELTEGIYRVLKALKRKSAFHSHPPCFTHHYNRLTK